MNTETEIAANDLDAELQQAMESIPLERAPASLRRKLRRIPRRQKALDRPSFFVPRWAFAMAAAPLLVALFIQPWGVSTDDEVIRGKRDLALALTYFEKVNRRASAEISMSIDSGFSGPVTENTVRTLQQQLGFNREYEL